MTVPNLFHLVRNDLGSKLVDQYDDLDQKTIKHISKWSNSEISKMDHGREIKKLRFVFKWVACSLNQSVILSFRTSFILRLIQIHDSEFSKLPRRYQNQQIIWKKENKIYAMTARTDSELDSDWLSRSGYRWSSVMTHHVSIGVIELDRIIWSLVDTH